jgi:hypothetical protein
MAGSSLLQKHLLWLADLCVTLRRAAFVGAVMRPLLASQLVERFNGLGRSTRLQGRETAQICVTQPALGPGLAGSQLALYASCWGPLLFD